MTKSASFIFCIIRHSLHYFYNFWNNARYIIIRYTNTVNEVYLTHICTVGWGTKPLPQIKAILKTYTQKIIWKKSQKKLALYFFPFCLENEYIFDYWCFYQILNKIWCPLKSWPKQKRILWSEWDIMTFFSSFSHISISILTTFNKEKKIVKIHFLTLNCFFTF